MKSKELLIFNNNIQFNAFEIKMRNKLGLPRVGVRRSDGVPQPQKQQTTAYTTSIKHPEKDSKNDLRVVCWVDNNADKNNGEMTISKVNAKTQGWFKEED
jgi:hypothetical protein